MPSTRRGPRISFYDFVESDTMTHGHLASRNTDDTGSDRIWIIIVSVAGVLAVGACIALVAMFLSRRRLKKQLLEEARQRDPCLGAKEFSKRRRMTRDILDFESESQRDAIIRKSLASRSGRSMSSNSRSIFDTISVDERPDSRATQDYSLREEEEFERSFTRSRSGTGLSDKSWEGGISSRSKSPFPDLPARTWSRSSSPSRSSHPAPERADLPPLLEKHPLFRNMSDDLDSELERK